VEFYCIGDDDAVRGFRLAGVRGRAVNGAAATAEALEEAAARADCGVIIITSAAAGLVRARLNEIKERSRPLIAEI